MIRSTLFRALPPLACVAALASSALPAQAGVSLGLNVGVPVVSAAGPVGAVSVRYGGGRGYYRGGGHGGWGWGWGLGLGLLVASPWLLAPPPVVTVVETVPPPPPPQMISQPMPGRPEPVIYPRNGQSAQQTEADRQECNRWATTQPAAMADASVFHRAVEACMDARGYTLR